MEKITPPDNIMGTKPINKLLFSMSLPIMISMMVQALYNIVDSVFVAQIGENALAAVSLAYPVQGVMISFAMGTGIGINSLLSRCLGERDFSAVNKSALNGLFIVWITCILFAVSGYLFSGYFFTSQTNVPEIIESGKQYLSIVCVFSFGMFTQMTLETLLTSTGKSFYAMISQTIGAVTNIVLDPIMIFGLFGVPKMGVTGAAIATVIGQSVGTLIALFLNLKVNHEIKLSFKSFRPEGKVIKGLFSVGGPSILMESIASVMIYGINLILLSFTVTATALFGVYYKVQSIIFMTVFGINGAIVPIIAFNYGAKNKERIMKTIRLSMVYAVVITAAGLLVFELFPDKLLALFNAGTEMMAIGIPALRIIATNFIFAGICIIFMSVFQALGNGMESLYMSIMRQLIVLLPVAWLMSLTGTINNVWWAFPISECATLVLGLFFIKRVYEKKLKGLRREAAG